MIVGDIGMFLIIAFVLTFMTPIVTVICINELGLISKENSLKTIFINTLLFIVVGTSTFLLIKYYRPFEWLYLYLGIVGLVDIYLFIRRKKNNPNSTYK